MSMTSFYSLKPRENIYKLYWEFAAKRQSIFEKRVAGVPAPWTDDRILERFKFCNVYRATDRVSQYLIRDVIYRHSRDSLADRLFRIVAFRTFSNERTWNGLREELKGEPRIEHLRSGALGRALDRLKRRHGGLYTGAFILCANKAFGHDEKHRNHVELFKTMFLKNDLANR